MKSLISKTAHAAAFIAAMSITTLLLYVHAVDREYLGAPAAVASNATARMA